MRALYLLPLLLLPLAAQAADDCPHEAARNLDLDLSGVDSLIIDIGRHDLALAGVAGSSGTVRGKACASHASHLEHLQVEQERDGSRLLLRAVGDSNGGLFSWLFDGGQHELRLQVEIPDSLPVMLKVGSGDARVENLQSLELSIGSGDAQVRQLGSLQAKVGSGDLIARDIGALRIDSVGSGDITVDGVRSEVTVGSVGSGDLVLRTVEGGIEMGSIGSGDVTLKDITGNVSVRSIGSGDLSANRVSGNLTLQRKGSGKVRHSEVAGSVMLP